MKKTDKRNGVIRVIKTDSYYTIWDLMISPSMLYHFIKDLKA